MATRTKREPRGRSIAVPALSPSVEHALTAESLDLDAIDSLDAQIASTSSYRVPDTEIDKTQAPATKRHPRSYPYQPRTGAARERNKEAQKRYRQRLKERAVEAEAELASVAAEVEALRAEQVALHEQNRALEMVRYYSESLLGALRSAAGSLVSSANSVTAALLSIHTDILDYLWSKALQPTDAQIRFLARHVDRLPLSALSNIFVGRLVAAVEQWHRSPPAGREAVEKKLSGIFESRARLISIVLTEFPETKAAHVMRPHGVETSLRELIDGAASLSSSDVLDTVVLTSEQTAALNSHWDVYLARYRGAKGLVTAAAGQVQMASESFVSEVNSLRGAMRRNADAQRGAAAAQAFLAEERAARADLLAEASRTLNPIQCAWLQLMAVRVLRDPDVVGAVCHILPHMTRAPVPTPAELLALVGDAGVEGDATDGPSAAGAFNAGLET